MYKKIACLVLFQGYVKKLLDSWHLHMDLIEREELGNFHRGKHIKEEEVGNY